MICACFYVIPSVHYNLCSAFTSFLYRYILESFCIKSFKVFFSPIPVLDFGWLHLSRRFNISVLIEEVNFGQNCKISKNFYPRKLIQLIYLTVQPIVLWYFCISLTEHFMRTVKQWLINMAKSVSWSVRLSVHTCICC